MNQLRKQTFILTSILLLTLLIVVVACRGSDAPVADPPQASTEVQQEAAQSSSADGAAADEVADDAESEDADVEAEVTEEETVDAEAADTEAEDSEEVAESEPAAEAAVEEAVVEETVVEETVAEAAPVETENAEAENAEAENAEAESVAKKGEPNRLINEKSPYLLQHAYNPVDWYPWGEEAFAKAAAEDKPIFLSIGYSTCHWCHVMKRESFEDEEVAQLMNDSFIAVKLDREERPDIDDIYMNVAQLMQTRGGWPLNVLLTPDQKPFFVATYIPRESRFQRVGMIELVPQINDAWATRRGEVVAFADQITSALQPPQMSTLAELANADAEVGTDTLGVAYNQLSQRYDAVHGGFGTQPKFPSPHNMLFLLRYWQRTGDDQALTMVETTLKNMHRGGIYDQLGYGFHRYSTDQRWKLPHFEKMLYDQAMLSMTYTEAFQITKDDEYERIARQIFTYVQRDMTHQDGAFFSAENADSAEYEGGPEEEGLFYFWTIEEIEEILDDEEANLVITMSGMTEEGNFLEEATRQPIGTNIIYWDKPLDETAAALDLDPAELEARLEPIRQKLFDDRTHRVYPSKDDKILTDWNGLMIAAFAKAGRAFDEPRYVEAASQAADFILTNMVTDEGRLLHRYRDGEFGLQANIDNYAFMVWGLLELYEATFDLTYLEAAIDLNTQQQAHFWDETVGGFYFTPDDGEKLIARQKAIYDGAIPSGNSVAVSNLLRLGRITADASYEDRAADVTRAFIGQIMENPTSYTHLMSGVEFGAGTSYEVIIVGDEGADDTQSLLAALDTVYVPNKVVLLRGMEDDTPLVSLADYTKYYYAIDDRATAYVCQNYICEQPTNDPAVMVSLLTKEGGTSAN